LDATIPILPPAAADLRLALDSLIEQGLDGQFPAHPKFNKDELRLTSGLVQQAYESIREALEAPDGRVAIDRDLRKKLRPLLEPLDLAQVGEQFLAVKTSWFDRFDPREAQLPRRSATVGELRKWMNEPNRMGLPDLLENLVILTYACQANRLLTLQGIPLPGSLTALRDEILLERQKLPDQAIWEQVCERTSHIFGVTIPVLPSLANLQKLNDQVSDLSMKFGPDVTNYHGKLQKLLPAVVGAYSDLPRYKTAVAMSALCQSIQRAKKPLEVFEAIRVAEITSPSAMGEVFKQSAKVHRAIDQIRLDVFEKLGQISDEPRAGVAGMLRQNIQDALTVDEHVTALEGIVGRWLNDSMKLLLDAPREPVPPPLPPISQPTGLSPLVPLIPGSPERMIITGQRKTTGLAGWRALKDEIEQELTEDAELEMNWQIMKRQPE
jgi:hypothetical protein